MNVMARRAMSERLRLLGLRRTVFVVPSPRPDPICIVCKVTSCAGCRQAIVADLVPHG
jgi:hypothetical protein